MDIFRSHNQALQQLLGKEEVAAYQIDIKEAKWSL
jgi:hypothetical protein